MSDKEKRDVIRAAKKWADARKVYFTQGGDKNLDRLHKSEGRLCAAVRELEQAERTMG